MPKVIFVDQGIEIVVPTGTTLLEAAQLGHAPEGSACGGVCACSTCHVHVEQGAGCLSERDDDEEDILDKAFDVKMTSRLGCQARIVRDGEIRLKITPESLETYYNEHPNLPRPPR